MQNEDVNLKGILVFLGILVLTMAGVYAGVAAMSRRLASNAGKSDAQALRQSPPVSAIAGRPYFPFPREQPNPLTDLKALRAQEDTELDSYGWIDKTNGVVRIPIDRAIELLTQSPERRP